MNLKEVVLSRLNSSSAENHFPQNKRNRIKTKPTNATVASEEVQLRNNSPSILSDEMLFPSHSKWELINGSSALETVKQPPSMKKVFNKTLQAWVVQDTHYTQSTKTIQDIPQHLNTPKMPTSSPPPPTSPGQVEEDRNKEPTNIGDFILDLLSEVESAEENKKPNFMNLKEVVLSRLNSSSAENHFPQNKRNRIKTKPTNATASSEEVQLRNNSPSILSDEMLFPSHSKWELINGSSALETVKQPPSMKKVFNKTLQAWVVQDTPYTQSTKTIQDIPQHLNTPKMPTSSPTPTTTTMTTPKPVDALEELKMKISSADNIEDITAIFDNLATKLGFTQPNPGKNPPFSMNKLKEIQKFHATSSTNAPTTSTTTHRTTITTTPRIFSSSSSEVVEGEAEVEVVDPNKYEDLLKLSSQMITSSTEKIPPTLVTLLPVRSNSGIRTFKPITEHNSSTSLDIESRNEGRADTESSSLSSTISSTTLLWQRTHHPQKLL
uniref:Uncharacterized protein n=1 Tax=Megaselia scalaris TaxID=36166 RepID=T1GCR7_MEGSC